MVAVERAVDVSPGAGHLEARRDRLDEVADRWVAHIVAKNSGYLDTALVPLPDLRKSCRDNIEAVLRLLAGETGAEPYAVVRPSARRQAERGVPIDVLLRSYRLAGLAIWQTLVDASPEAPELFDVASSLWLIIDEVSAEFATCY